MTTKTQHTPGPWRVSIHTENQRAKTGAFLITSDVRHIAALRSINTDRPSEQRAADARLIAAAPELLAALQLCVHSLQDIHADAVPGAGNAWAAACAAIAKAGQS